MRGKRTLNRIRYALYPRSKPEEERPIPTYRAYVNTPRHEWNKERTVKVEGWLLPDAPYEVSGFRIKNNDTYHPLEYGTERQDVLKAFGHEGEEKALYSGFKAEFEYQEGIIEIHADFGEGWQTIMSQPIKYSPEDLVPMLLQPSLADNMAKHQNLIANRKEYQFETALKAAYHRHEDDARLVAFYLPQYHPIKQNDRAWGKGFTEWTNVTTAKPRFVGHNQPMLPSDLGFYDLRVEDTIKEQISLAKSRGIYGFCFYYYWFSGERLLEQPLDIFLKHKEWDFNFMIAWANENWTKRWDGLDNEVIIAQKYLKDDPLKFIHDVEHILLDPRYIREDGKPVLVVYRASRLDDPQRYVKAWRKYFKDTHATDLHIVSVLGLDVENPAKIGFDSAIEFEPLTIAKRTDFNKQYPLPRDISSELLDQNFQGGVADYRQVALRKHTEHVFDYDTYKSVMPSWDNDARKKGNGATIFCNASPDVYGKWLDDVIKNEQDKSPIIFINAWNEWAEGAVLEPTMHGGHGYLNRTSQIMAQNSKNPDNQRNFPLYGIVRSPKVKTAVIVHVYYETEWRYIADRLKLIPEGTADLYITLTRRASDLEADIRLQFPKAYIVNVPNRGRDILPFVIVGRRLMDLGYEYILKLHTKKSTHRQNGAKWFGELVDALLPNTKSIESILFTLKEGTAIIGPENHYLALASYIGSNEVDMTTLMTYMFDEQTTYEALGDTSRYGYFGGSMFWCRTDALKKLFDLFLDVDDFEAEMAQIDGTMAHAVERLFTLVPLIEGKTIANITRGGSIHTIDKDGGITEYEYA